MSPGKSQEDDYDFVDVEGDVQFDDMLVPKTSKKRIKSERAATLELDLQFSSEDELDEVPLTEFESDQPDQKGILISAEMPVEGADDDSQQAAEAMVQLGSMSFYQPGDLAVPDNLVFKGKFWLNFVQFEWLFVTTEESMDVDPNYDPSDFLMSGLASVRKVNDPIQGQDIKIHDDLAVSESDDDNERPQEMQKDYENMPEDEDGVWF